GDAYMCAGGLPAPRPGSTRDTALAALEMQAWLRDHNRDRQAKGLPTLTMRAGIHTGTVVAGMVDDTKFQYDVWGDVVNIAARMQESGAVGMVNITEENYLRLRDEPALRFTPRGRIAVKSKGELPMFFVERADPVA
ncbi:MAG: adenylate/guanylate cyclase domain-containing protein, partial [Flavobacteriales bacterium]